MTGSTNPHDTLAPRPPHVAPDRVFDLDVFAPPGLAENVHLAWKHVQDSAPEIFWTPHYGGHWMATRAEDIRHMQQNHADFSHREMFLPRGTHPDHIPVNLDPPQHTPYRKLLMPAFLPRAIADIEARAREVAIELIEQLAPQGRCEFVTGFAAVMPIIAFLTMMGLPEEDHVWLRGKVGYLLDPHVPEFDTAWGDLARYAGEWIERRRAEPSDDLISMIAQGRIDDRPLTGDEVCSLVVLLLGGGLDTVASMMSFIAQFLAEHPDHRRQLIERPEIIPAAVEEFARRFGTTNTGRLVTRDLQFKDVTLRQGEMIVLPNPLVGLDERLNPDPLRVDFARKPAHAAFGGGVHICPGAILARRELRIFLEEWLKRIPDFHLAPGKRPRATTGVVNSMAELWLEWDQGSMGEAA